MPKAVVTDLLTKQLAVTVERDMRRSAARKLPLQLALLKQKARTVFQKLILEDCALTRPHQWGPFRAYLAMII